MPFGRGRRFGSNMPRWADSIAGQWMVTGITTFSTGEPVYLVSPNQTGSLRTSHRPNRVCDGRSRLFSGTVRSNGFLWFDTSCFEVPPPKFFGNSGFTVINAPGLNNWDVGVQKVLPLGRDRAVLQVRAEMFNTWNHAQFQQPNGDAGAGANFGRISATRSPRLVQVALKILW
jgi:hypothetical protein